jgi:hypothetical protein
MVQNAHGPQPSQGGLDRIQGWIVPRHHAVDLACAEPIHPVSRGLGPPGTAARGCRLTMYAYEEAHAYHCIRGYYPMADGRVARCTRVEGEMVIGRATDVLARHESCQCISFTKLSGEVDNSC